MSDVPMGEESLTDLVQNAMQDAESPETIPDATGDSTDVAESASPDTTTDTPKDTAQDAIEALLESEGIKRTQPGQRENRIPYTRVQKIIKNAQKKWQDESGSKHSAELKSRETKLTEYQERIKLLDTLEQMASGDDERFIRMLAANNPRYSRYLKVLEKDAEAEAKRSSAPSIDPNDPKPMPDGVHQDGSPGYTQDGLDELNEWQIRQAEKRAVLSARKEMEKEYGPIKERFQAQQTREQMRPVVQQKYIEACELYGKDAVDANKDAISEAIAKDRASGRNSSLEAIMARVLVPKQREAATKAAVDGTKARQAVIKDMQKRPAAASKGAFGSVKTPETTGDESMEDLVKNAMRAAEASGMR